MRFLGRWFSLSSVDPSPTRELKTSLEIHPSFTMAQRMHFICIYWPSLSSALTCVSCISLVHSNLGNWPSTWICRSSLNPHDPFSIGFKVKMIVEVLAQASFILRRGFVLLDMYLVCSVHLKRFDSFVSENDEEKIESNRWRFCADLWLAETKRDIYTCGAPLLYGVNSLWVSHRKEWHIPEHLFGANDEPYIL